MLRDPTLATVRGIRLSAPLRLLAKTDPRAVDEPCSELCGRTLRDVMISSGGLPPGPSPRGAPLRAAGGCPGRRTRLRLGAADNADEVCGLEWWTGVPVRDDGGHAVAVAACRVWVGVASDEPKEVRSAMAAMTVAIGDAAAARGVLDSMGVLLHAVWLGASKEVVDAIAWWTTRGGKWTAGARRLARVLGRGDAVAAMDEWHGAEAGALDAGVGVREVHWGALGGRLWAGWDDGRWDVGAVDASGDTVVHYALVGASVGHAVTAVTRRRARATWTGARAGSADPPAAVERRRMGPEERDVGGASTERRWRRRWDEGAAGSAATAAAVAAVIEAARRVGVADAAAHAGRRRVGAEEAWVDPMEWWYGGTLFRRNARGWTAAHEAAAMGGDGGPCRLRAAAVGAVLREATRSYGRNVGACVQREQGHATADGWLCGSVPPDWRVDTHAVETDGAARLLEVTDVVGQTALHVAARQGHGDAVRVVVDTLVDAGYGDVVLWEDDAQCDALLYAARSGDADAVVTIGAQLVAAMAIFRGGGRDCEIPLNRMHAAAGRALGAAVAAAQAETARAVLDGIMPHSGRQDVVHLPLTANNSRVVADIASRYYSHVYLGQFEAWPEVGAPTGDGVSAEERRLWPATCMIAWAIASDDTMIIDQSDFLSKCVSREHHRMAIYNHRPNMALRLTRRLGTWALVGGRKNANCNPSPWLRGLPRSHRFARISAADATFVGLVALPQRRAVDSAAWDATWGGVLEGARGENGAGNASFVRRAAEADGAAVGRMYTSALGRGAPPADLDKRVELAARSGLERECNMLSGAAATDTRVGLPAARVAALRGAVEGGQDGHVARQPARAEMDTDFLKAATKQGNLVVCRALVKRGALYGGHVDRRALLVAAVPHPTVLEYLCDAMAERPLTPTPKPCLGRLEACDLRFGFCSAHNPVCGAVSLATFLVLWRRDLLSTIVETDGGLVNPHASLRAVCAARGAFGSWLRARPEEHEADVWMRVRVAAGLVPRIHDDSARWWYGGRYHLLRYVIKHSTPATRAADFVAYLKANDRHIESPSVDQVIGGYRLDLTSATDNASLLRIAARSHFALIMVMHMLATSGELAAALNARDAEGNMPLHGVRSGFAVTVLVAAGANVNVRNLCGQTPLITATRGTDDVHRISAMLQAAEAVRSAGASGFEALLRGGLSPSTAASLDDMLVRLGAALDAMPRDASTGVVDVDARDGDGRTAVLHALSIVDGPKRNAVLTALLDAGASVSIGDAKGLRSTPLIDAVEFHDRKLVKKILALGAGVNETDARGRTALHVWSHPSLHTWSNMSITSHKMLSTLLDGGADVNAKDYWGDTPLSSACEGRAGHEVVRAMLAAGGDPNTRIRSGGTILITTIMTSSYQEAMALLEGGADVHLQAADGTTAMSPLETVMRARPDEQTAQQALYEALVQRGACATIPRWDADPLVRPSTPDAGGGTSYDARAIARDCCKSKEKHLRFGLCAPPPTYTLTCTCSAPTSAPNITCTGNLPSVYPSYCVERREVRYAMSTPRSA